MAVDKFNSVGGFSVGIPPVEIIDGKGNITAPSGNFDKLQANVGNIGVLESNIANINTVNANHANIVTAFVNSANFTTIDVERLTGEVIRGQQIIGNTGQFGNVTIADRLNVKDVYARNLFGTIHSNVVAGALQVDAADTEVIFSKETGNIRTATGSPDFTFIQAISDYDGSNAVPSQLNVSGDLNVRRVNIGTPATGKIIHEAIAGTTFDRTTQTLHQIASTGDVEAVEYTIIATRTLNSVQTERHTCKMVASVLGNDIRYYEYGTAINNGVVGDFEIIFYNGSLGRYIQLIVNPAFSTGVVNYKIFSIIYKG